jgi:putative peptidoglycan lipid II flippase
MSQMLKSSGAMGAATLASRLLGMVREIVYARFMGDGWVAGAFVLAFTIPNLFRRLLGEGALTAAFIPILKEKEHTADTATLWRAANAVLTTLVIVSVLLIAGAIFGITTALKSRALDQETRLMLELLRIMFPYMLLVCVAAVFIGILNARGHFFIPALGATMLNVVMIASVLWFTPFLGKRLEEQIFALAVGVLVAGAAQAAFQIPTLRGEGFRFRWVWPWADDTVGRVVRQMIPGTIGVAAFQINVLVTQGVAFWVDAPIVASFNYAVRLMELPQGVFGVSLATYLLPTLAGLAVKKNFNEFRATLRQGLGYIIFVNLLASVLLFVLAEPIVRLLFEHGRFGPDATVRAAFALRCLAPGLVFFSIVNIVARAFYALGDTTMPMKISLVCLFSNVVLALWMVLPRGKGGLGLEQGGLGVANTVSAGFNAWLLLLALRDRLDHLGLGGLRRSLGPNIAIAAAAGALAWGMEWLWEERFGHARLEDQLGAVFVPATCAATLYGVLAFLLRIPAAREAATLVWRKVNQLFGG